MCVRDPYTIEHTSAATNSKFKPGKRAMKRTISMLTLLALIAAALTTAATGQAQPRAIAPTQAPAAATAQTPAKSFPARLSDAALELTKDFVVYDPAYFSIPYPGGDGPENTGVCTDVVIRAYRKLGIDLQKEVHEDMKANFSKYPNNWGLSRTDTNIDHRRVPNLMVFFSRHGRKLPVTGNAADYTPGDIVCWRLPGGATHIGIVVDKRTMNSGRNKIVHNIGYGQNLADCLFDWDIIGHYRYGEPSSHP
jgi:uncharacterized protein YijF (DUF1287 family)